MGIYEGLLGEVKDGRVVDVRVGIHWTAVVVEAEGQERCGLASTVQSDHGHSGQPEVMNAGRLAAFTARELAALVHSELPTEASVGMAALNALLPQRTQDWVECNAEEVIARNGAGKTVVIVGRFPFIPRLAEQVGKLIVLEQHPEGDELPPEAAARVLPAADVVAITGMTLANHTLEGLLALCRPQSVVLILGPSTPLSPVLYDYGIDLLSGSVVVDVDPVMRALEQGGNFRQLHQAGVRLVTMHRPGFTG